MKVSLTLLAAAIVLSQNAIAGGTITDLRTNVTSSVQSLRIMPVEPGSAYLVVLQGKAEKDGSGTRYLIAMKSYADASALVKDFKNSAVTCSSVKDQIDPAWCSLKEVDFNVR